MDILSQGFPKESLAAAAATAKSLQSCPTPWDLIDSSPPGSPIPGILQVRTLEWVAISSSNAWKWKVKSLSRVRLLATTWTAAYQAPPSMGFARQEYWSGVPLPSLPHKYRKSLKIYCRMKKNWGRKQFALSVHHKNCRYYVHSFIWSISWKTDIIDFFWGGTAWY